MHVFPHAFPLLQYLQHAPLRCAGCGAHTGTGVAVGGRLASTTPQSTRSYSLQTPSTCTNPARSTRTARAGIHATCPSHSRIFRNGPGPNTSASFAGGTNGPIPNTSTIVLAGSSRTGVSPLLRGVEIGLAHGLLVTGPFIKLGPLRDAANGVAEKAGCASGAGLVLILTACLAMYGASTFQNEGAEALGVKTLSGRAVARDPLQSGAGWSAFTAGWLVGGLSGVAWAYVLTQVLPYYS